MGKLLNALEDYNKFYEKNLAKNYKKGVLIALLIFSVMGVGFYMLLSADTRKQKRIETYIENGDYVNARKTLVSLNNGMGGEHQKQQYEQYFQKISKAQIAGFIDDGDFSTAQDIALEDDNYDYYLNSFLGKLISLYNNYGINKVYEGLAIIKMPNEVDSYNNRANVINNAIEGLAIMMVDKEDANRLCTLLKPTKDSNGKTNNKEIEAIKKRIGIK